MISLKGVPASDGYALAKAMKIDIVDEFPENLMITFDEKVAEAEKLKIAIEKLNDILDKKIKRFQSENRTEEAKYFMVHQYILNNKILEEWAYEFIEYEYTAVSAVSRAIKKQIEFIKNLDNENLEKRIPDIIEVGKRLMYLLSGLTYPDIFHIEDDVILICDDIPTNMMRSVDHNHVKGLVLRKGSTKSHTTLISVDMEIPCVISCKNYVDEIKNGEIIFIDGEKGTVNYDLCKVDILDSMSKLSKYSANKACIKEYANMPTITKDGKSLKIFGNVIDVNTSAKYKKVGADGIGLFRTDFLYTDYENLPSEDFQFNVYKTIAEQKKEKSFIIRTMDTGDDKVVSGFNLEHERNPFLGYRAIRISLAKPEIFLTQIRAILKASAYGNVKILFPLISNKEDILGALETLEKAKTELRKENIPFNENIEVGMVIEVPSSGLMIDTLIKYVDFVAISGTALTQYMLAVDRLNPAVAHRFNTLEPSILRIIKYVSDTAKKANKFCYIYGETVAEPKNIYVFIGLGIESFSINPTKVLPIRKFISTINYENAIEDAKKILLCESVTEIENFLKKLDK